jgi:hypothetical protein
MSHGFSDDTSIWMVTLTECQNLDPEKNPRLTAANSQLSELQCGMYYQVLEFSFMFVNDTVTSDVYFNLLRNKFVPFLEEYGTAMKTA